MATKLFVGNLPYSTMDHQLEAVFSEHGKVLSANVVVDQATGRSRGFGFVEFDNPEEAQAAISALDGSEFEGRTLAVNAARPRAPRRDSGGPGFGGGGGGGGRGGPPRSGGGGDRRGGGGGGGRGRRGGGGGGGRGRRDDWD